MQCLSLILIKHCLTCSETKIWESNKKKSFPKINEFTCDKMFITFAQMSIYL